eukprot:evm.model.scf_685.1 EVM.evm.TU.scf_685.1   scf_685:13715-14599(-)
MKGKVRRGCGGPCNHCGRTCSPCWRKGPPEKPVLCNACGARYLVKRNLEGYMPGQKAGGAGPPREAARQAPHVMPACDRDSTGSSGRSTGDRRSISSSSLSHTLGVRTRGRRRPFRRLGVNDDHELDLMDAELAGGDEECSRGPAPIARCGRFDGCAVFSDEEYLENLAHVAACTLAMLRYSGLRLKAVRGRVVRRGAVIKPVAPRYRITNRG